MANKPMFIEPRTFRDRDCYMLEVARVKGWNEAMRFIFPESQEAAQAKRSAFTAINGQEARKDGERNNE